MLVIEHKVLEQLFEHLRRTYPQEGCGAFLGRLEGDRKAVSEIRPLANRHEEAPETRYTVDPKEHLTLEREARTRGLAILGFYHSHPDHPARPSEFDRQHAHAVYVYLVVRVAKGQVDGATAWVLDEASHQFTEEPLEIVP